ncbi:pyrroline-5-carboxylate reductase [Thioflexithrix psekupsensis]|uniref:Pyrroline-5-carboxylate reductase n=1 Tax=Thioflexithrix psekupsensis TaxID=1570016 RepID=A0A251X5U7_9GAMM|nr:pyrroline-5-carboxylate reductase [Thioflexithrix psekupsensis]OUD12880.1 pyrroline-5-carboxylate reductase [Thioflexithrix psekupsensis]
MDYKNITFIGGGNMASSLIGGLLATGTPARSLQVIDTESNPLAAQFPINCHTDYTHALRSEVVVLAVKPQQMANAIKHLTESLPINETHTCPLIISVAAGIRLDSLTQWLGIANAPLVRVMPNTPSLVGSGAAALFANVHTSAEQRATAEAILRAVGLTVWLDSEAQMDAVTALSGSGPAYFFLFMELLEQVGVDLGLSQETARLLTLQTAFGAAKMALESADNAATLRARVTSPGGTTEQAIAVLQQGGLSALLHQALHAAQQRSITLAEQLGEKQ